MRLRVRLIPHDFHAVSASLRCRTAQRSIDRNQADFDSQLSELKGKIFMIMWRQDWFVIERFNRLVQNPNQFSTPTRFEELRRSGLLKIRDDQIDALRRIVVELWEIQIVQTNGENMFDEVNVIKG